MTALFTPSDPGVDLPVLIDGVELSILPADMDIEAEHVADYLDMLDGGAVECERRPHFAGVADYSDRFTFSIPYGQVSGDDLTKLKLMRVRGGAHRITLWRYEPIVYTCKAGVQRYYLPRFRKCAPHLYAGLVIAGGRVISPTSIPNIPTLATLNGSPLTDLYAEGPTLADPGAAAIRIARQPDASGPAMDYTAMRLGDTVVTGDELIVWMCLTYETSLRSTPVRLSGVIEDRAQTFVEV